MTKKTKKAAPAQPQPQKEWPSKVPGKKSGKDRDSNPPKNSK